MANITKAIGDVKKTRTSYLIFVDIFKPIIWFHIINDFTIMETAIVSKYQCVVVIL